MAYKHIEKPVMKKDAMNHLLGKPVYVDDITSQDCLVVKVLRSPHAHALIEEIDVSKAQKIPGIEAVYTYKDVPQNELFDLKLNDHKDLVLETFDLPW